jgi:hypothetical protein
MKSPIRTFTLLTMLSVLLGCSVFRSHTQIINVTCSEPEAKLTVNDWRETSPFKGWAFRNKSVIIQCEKEGYEVAARFVNYHLNATGYLDIVGGFLVYIPYVGLFFPGAYSLDDTDIKVQMIPLSEAPSHQQEGFVGMLKVSHHEIEKKGESPE